MGPGIAPLRNVAQFQRFYLSPVLHTIAWENEADFAPEYCAPRCLNRRRRAPPCVASEKQPHAETQRAQSRNRNGRNCALSCGLGCGFKMAFRSY